MKLYLIRHGESENNKNGVFSGWDQASLTEKGVKDAFVVCNYLKNIAFEKVYSSDLLRAKQTAQTALPEHKYEENALLREFNFGTLAGKSFASCQEEYGKAFVDNFEKLNLKVYDGEDDNEFTARVSLFMEKMVKSGFEKVAAFSHAGVLRKVLDYVFKTKAPHEFIACNNCTIAIFEYENKKWKLNSWINSQQE